MNQWFIRLQFNKYLPSISESLTYIVSVSNAILVTLHYLKIQGWVYAVATWMPILYCDVTKFVSFDHCLWCSSFVDHTILKRQLHWGTHFSLSCVWQLLLTNLWPLNPEMAAVFLYHVNFVNHTTHVFLK